MRRFVLGTAGHVDHGKTTLVQALTGVDTDRLPEEKKRGITIELGFAPWTPTDSLSVSFIDVPGHRRLVHTMIAGASGIEAVLLVVSGDEGVMPQTREHVEACALLGIKRAVVAVTKLDRAGRDVAELAGEEALELLGDRFGEPAVVPVSAKTGEGMDDLRKALVDLLEDLEPPAPSPRVFLSVDRVFSVKGAGTVVTGTLVRGKLKAGAALRVVGRDRVLDTSARTLHVHDKTMERVEAPTRLALNLSQLSVDDIARGDVVTDDPTLDGSALWDVELWMSTEPKRGQTAQVYAGTTRASMRFDRRISEEGATPALWRLRLQRRLPVVGGDRFVIRGGRVDGPAGAVMGGGRVLDAQPPRGKYKPTRQAVLNALAAGEAEAVLDAWVDEAAPRSVDVRALGTRFVVPAPQLIRAADAGVGAKRYLRTKGGVVRDAALADLANRASALVAAHHADKPLERGFRLQTLREKLSSLAGEDVATVAIERAQKAAKPEKIVVDADVVYLPSFAAKAPAGQAAASLDEATTALASAGLKGMTEHGLREATGAGPKDIRAIMARLVREEEAGQAGDLWFAASVLNDLRARVRAHLAQRGELTIADFKALTDLGRRQTIPLLELLDKEGITKREGDVRRPGPSA